MQPSHASDEALLRFFDEHGTRLRYNKGEFIIRPGESLPGVFFITKGLVKSYDITKCGDENLLVIRKAGELLGMIVALTGNDRHILYSALVEVEVILMRRAVFDKELARTPEVALPLLQMVTEMYRVGSERILNLEYRTVRERLISFLLSMERRFGRATEHGDVLIDVPLRHQDIASSISATRETTGRVLTSLERKKLLSNNALYITLHDVQAIRELL